MADAGSAVVTGAAMGMGKAIAARLVADGVVVAGLDRDESALDETAAELGDAFVPVAGDVGDWAAHERAADAAEARGPLRHWVNNAGIDIASPAHEATQQHIDDGLRVLLMGVMYGCAIAVRRMLPDRRGSIVNISSIQGVAAWPRYLVYDAAKAGILGATRNVALDYAPYGIRCERRPPRQRSTPRCSRRTSRTIRWRPSDGSPARRRWHRCSGSAIRPRSPRWSPSCSPTRRRSSPAPR